MSVRALRAVLLALVSVVLLAVPANALAGDMVAVVGTEIVVDANMMNELQEIIPR